MLNKKHSLIALSLLLSASALYSFSFSDTIDRAKNSVKNFSKFSKPADLTAEDVVDTMSGGMLSTELITEAFKEALKKGVEYAVDTLGKEGGFMDNPATMIPLPPPFSQIESVLRAAGAGDILDDFILSMNRAAAKAAPQTAGIFAASIDKMSFNKAMDILMMDGSPATDYFKKHTRKELKELITPLVIEAMKDNDVYKFYKQVSKVSNPMAKTMQKTANFGGMAKKLGFKKFIPEEGVNLDDYVTQYTIDGIYLMIAQQEKMIRTNPAHQTSAKLRKVFGSVMPK